MEQSAITYNRLNRSETLWTDLNQTLDDRFSALSLHGWLHAVQLSNTADKRSRLCLISGVMFGLGSVRSALRPTARKPQARPESGFQTESNQLHSSDSFTNLQRCPAVIYRTSTKQSIEIRPCIVSVESLLHYSLCFHLSARFMIWK